MASDNVSVLVQGVVIPGAEVDGEPFLDGIGAELKDASVLAAVLPRADLEHVPVYRFVHQTRMRHATGDAVSSRTRGLGGALGGPG